MPEAFEITIMVSAESLDYSSDFAEPETIFWLEAVKNLILEKAYD
jgi:hypothetical protein